MPRISCIGQLKLMACIRKMRSKIERLVTWPMFLCLPCEMHSIWLWSWWDDSSGRHLPKGCWPAKFSEPMRWKTEPAPEVSLWPLTSVLIRYIQDPHVDSRAPHMSLTPFSESSQTWNLSEEFTIILGHTKWNVMDMPRHYRHSIKC